MKRLSRDHHIYYLDPAAPPAIVIESGDELLVETWDAFEGIRDAAAFMAKDPKGPATGPIYVSGAEPGDALRIDFLRITLTGDEAALPCGIRLPLRPSMGFVATTPEYRQTTASDSGPYGGDIDMQELVTGSTLFLPVIVPGGMLALGDCHA